VVVSGSDGAWSGVLAMMVYLWLGLKFLSKTWFNLDLVWAASLFLVDTFRIYSAVYGR